MSVYVDPLMAYGWVLRGRKTESCHMFADTVDELHAMAVRIGMKRSWFQVRLDRPKRPFPHYDLTPAKRTAAVLAGAVDLTHHDQSLSDLWRNLTPDWQRQLGIHPNGQPA